MAAGIVSKTLKDGNGGTFTGYFFDDGTGTVTPIQGAGENHMGEVGGNRLTPSASFTRPANTTAYAVGQIVANSTTGGSVVPLSLTAARKNGGTGSITKARLSSSNTGAVGITFRVHFFASSPTTTNGDGAAFAGAVNGVTSGYLGSFDITLDKSFSDGAKGIGVPAAGAFSTFAAGAGTQTVFALLEARAAYTPTSGETLTLTVEVDRD